MSYTVLPVVDYFMRGSVAAENHIVCHDVFLLSACLLNLKGPAEKGMSGHAAYCTSSAMQSQAKLPLCRREVLYATRNTYWCNN